MINPFWVAYMGRYSPPFVAAAYRASTYARSALMDALRCYQMGGEL